MPILKLTLSFKGRLLAVFRLTRDTADIGRDPDADLPIDSLAVAPRHARLSREAEGVRLTALDADHPVFCNGQRIDTALLADGDLLLVGKHSLAVALDEEAGITPAWPPPPAPRRSRPPPPGAGGPAYLQVQSGPKIGKVIRLERAVTRLKRIGGTEVIVTRADHAYRLTRIGEANQVVVDGRVLEGATEVLLEHRVRVTVDGTQCQFFDPAADAPAAPAAPTAPTAQDVDETAA